jgi:hypothetical protein
VDGSARAARAAARRASRARGRGRTASFLTGPDMATDARHGLTPGRETNVFLWETSLMISRQRCPVALVDSCDFASCGFTKMMMRVALKIYRVPSDSSSLRGRTAIRRGRHSPPSASSTSALFSRAWMVCDPDAGDADAGRPTYRIERR